MNIESVKNCTYANAEKTSINCLVKFSHINEEIEFTASSHDVEERGVNLFNSIENGEYGNVLDYTPVILSDSDLASMARQNRNQLLLELDTIVSNPLRWQSFSESKKKEFSDYRQLLLDIPQQLSFPSNVVYPQLPEL